MVYDGQDIIYSVCLRRQLNYGRNSVLEGTALCSFYIFTCHRVRLDIPCAHAILDLGSSALRLFVPLEAPPAHPRELFKSRILDLRASATLGFTSR